MQQSNLERIKAIGFVRIGEWLALDGELNYEVHEEFLRKTNILYAFVASKEVMYVGKTTQPLRARIENYKYATRSTNIKNKTEIVECLRNGKVEIYALPDPGLWQYGGFHLNLAAGLEDGLIESLNPPWNNNGRSSK